MRSNLIYATYFFVFLTLRIEMDFTKNKWIIWLESTCFDGNLKNINWLVVDLPLWNIWKSTGRMTSQILWKVIKFMFQTTDQLIIHCQIGLPKKTAWNFQKSNVATEIPPCINDFLMNTSIYREICYCHVWLPKGLSHFWCFLVADLGLIVYQWYPPCLIT